jgi:hypothetical protein
MKTSEFRKLIREEVRKVMNEMPRMKGADPKSQKGKPFHQVDVTAAAYAISNEYESELDSQSWEYALKWLSNDFKLKPPYNSSSAADSQTADEIWKILEKRFGFTMD